MTQKVSHTFLFHFFVVFGFQGRQRALFHGFQEVLTLLSSSFKAAAPTLILVAKKLPDIKVFALVIELDPNQNMRPYQLKCVPRSRLTSCTTIVI